MGRRRRFSRSSLVEAALGTRNESPALRDHWLTVTDILAIAALPTVHHSLRWYYSTQNQPDYGFGVRRVLCYSGDRSNILSHGPGARSMPERRRFLSLIALPSIRQLVLRYTLCYHKSKDWCALGPVWKEEIHDCQHLWCAFR